MDCLKYSVYPEQADEDGCYEWMSVRAGKPSKFCADVTFKKDIIVEGCVKADCFDPPVGTGPPGPEGPPGADGGLAYHFGGRADQNNRYLKPSGDPNEPDSPLNSRTKTAIMKDAVITRIAVYTENGDATTECEITLNGVGQGPVLLTGMAPDTSVCVDIVPPIVVSCGDTLSFMGFHGGTQPDRMSAHVVTVATGGGGGGGGSCQNTLSVRLNTNLVTTGNTLPGPGTPFIPFPFQVVDSTPSPTFATFTYPNSFTVTTAGRYRVGITYATSSDAAPLPFSPLVCVAPDLSVPLGTFLFCDASLRGSVQILGTASVNRILNIYEADLPFTFETGYYVADNAGSGGTDTVTAHAPFTNFYIERLCDAQTETTLP